MTTHDDIADILAKSNHPNLSDNERLRLVLGLKLLGNLILANKNQAFFQ